MNSKIKNDSVPIRNINSSDARIKKLNKLFTNEFQCEPSFIVRVPGRVNIIGEHIDYCGYPVLPMALEQDILVAVGITNDTKLCLRNTNGKYLQYDTTINTFEDIKIVPDDNGKPHWYNYVLCGIKGALEHLKNDFQNGLQLLFDGNIPPASGLSSSSALVSASFLAFLHGQSAELSKTDIASLCATCERYIGTQGGGMDQAIAFLGQKYSAQYITFQPLKASPVELPEDATFVVAHSLTEANKAATNDFNKRVMECRLAAQIIALREGLETNQKIITLSQVQEKLNKTLEDMIQLVHKYLPKGIYSKTEICEILDMNEAEVNGAFLSENTKSLDNFKLKQRAQHVYEEALRVETFRKTCISTTNGNCNGSNGSFKNGNSAKDKIDVLGELMYDSHESLRSLYECSHENLDLLVKLSKDIGVYARLTGAGWGGCIVAICRKNDVDTYIAKIINDFYMKHCKLEANKAGSYIFSTAPNDGAIIYVK